MWRSKVLSAKAKAGNQLGSQLKSAFDVIPIIFEDRYVFPIEILQLEPDAANVAQHQAGFKNNILNEGKAESDSIKFIH